MPHPISKFQRQLISAKKTHEKKTQDRAGHVKRKLARQQIQEQEYQDELRRAAAIGTNVHGFYE